MSLIGYYSLKLTNKKFEVLEVYLFTFSFSKTDL